MPAIFWIRFLNRLRTPIHWQLSLSALWRIKKGNVWAQRSLDIIRLQVIQGHTRTSHTRFGKQVSPFLGNLTAPFTWTSKSHTDRGQFLVQSCPTRKPFKSRIIQLKLKKCAQITWGNYTNPEFPAPGIEPEMPCMSIMEDLKNLTNISLSDGY